MGSFIKIFKRDINYHDIIESLVAALEAKDYYTGGHSTRVADMADMVCKYLKIKKGEKEIIHIAAHLHDIGKIGIPDKILNKEGELLPHEWEQLKSHPEIGFNILSKSRELKKIGLIVLSHHERWDGKGYPKGLKEMSIPLGSRIIAICDSIDAMKSERPYRKPLRDNICKMEIKKNIGLMYDPVIAKCVLDSWENIVHKIY